MTIEIDWPTGHITATNADDAERQIMNLQDFGSYPLWAWVEGDDDVEEWDWEPDQWLRFDDVMGGTGSYAPRITAADLREYLAWSLNGAIAPDDIVIRIGGNDALRITPAELKARREALGYTTDDIAKVAGVNNRSPRAWESGREPVPVRIRTILDTLEAETNAVIHTVRAAIAAYQEQDPGDLAIITPTTDSAYRTRWPHAAHTARWWRATIHAATKNTTVRLIDNDGTLPLTIMTNVQPRNEMKARNEHDEDSGRHCHNNCGFSLSSCDGGRGI